MVNNQPTITNDNQPEIGEQQQTPNNQQTTNQQ